MAVKVLITRLLVTNVRVTDESEDLLKRMFQSLIPYWETENGELKSLKLYPIRLSMNGNRSEIGLPRFEGDADFMEDFAKRCESYGTRLSKSSDGSYECHW